MLIMLLEDVNNVKHPLSGGSLYFVTGVCSGGGWFDKVCQPGDLSKHTWREGMGAGCSVHNFFMMYGLNKFEIKLAGLSGSRIWWLVESSGVRNKGGRRGGYGRAAPGPAPTCKSMSVHFSRGLLPGCR